MNILNKKLLCVSLCVILVNFVYSFRPTTPENCNVPNESSRGLCIELSQCQPLLNISRTKDRSSPEYTFLTQCRSLCTDKLVCCPPKSEWKQVKYTPIDYTGNPSTTTATNSVNPLTTENTLNRYFEGVDNPKMTKCGIQTPKERIYGGNILSVDEYPWLALLDYMDDKSRCGGSLITNRFVVTAAHCIETQYGPPVKVRLAEYNTSSYPTDTVIDADGVPVSVNVTIINVEWCETYPGYAPRSNDDIGLVKMSETVQFSYFIRPICLPEVDFVAKVPAYTPVVTAGWGEDEEYESSDVKKKVDLLYRPLSECQDITFRTLSRKTHICAGGEDGKDSCKGDSGGPLMYRNGTIHVMVGIVSSGFYKCGDRKPAIYTNVYNYMDWIKGLINQE